jgi:hypothetical protein
MADHRETYKGRQIVIEGTPDKPELSIDGKQIFILRNASGAYLASGFAFDPQPSVGIGQWIKRQPLRYGTLISWR